jgi:predicted glycosyltransferase
VRDFYLPRIGRILGFPAVVITDTEPVAHDAFMTFPFAAYVLTPTCYKKTIEKKQIRYNSYNALAYLCNSGDTIPNSLVSVQAFGG